MWVIMQCDLPLFGRIRREGERLNLAKGLAIDLITDGKALDASEATPEESFGAPKAETETQTEAPQADQAESQPEAEAKAEPAQAELIPAEAAADELPEDTGELVFRKNENELPQGENLNVIYTGNGLVVAARNGETLSSICKASRIGLAQALGLDTGGTREEIYQRIKAHIG